MYHQLQNVLCGNRWYDIYKLVWMKLVLKQILRVFATQLPQIEVRSFLVWMANIWLSSL